MSTPSKINRSLSEEMRTLKQSILKQFPKTEGWLELFLSPAEKASFAQWNEIVEDRSFSGKLKRKTEEKGIIDLVPENVSPNLISLTGLCVLAQTWYVLVNYSKELPLVGTWLSVASLFIFYFTNWLDIKQSERIKQKTTLNDLFKYSCDCCSTVFLTLITTYCLGVTECVTQWYSVQTSLLVLFTKHLSAFHRSAGLRYSILAGPGEVITFCIVLLIARATFGIEWFISAYFYTVHKVFHLLAPYNISMSDVPVDDLLDYEVIGAELMKVSYWTIYIVSLVKILVLPKEHNWSRFGISVSLLMRMAPALFELLGTSSAPNLVPLDVISDGFFMSLLITDVMLAKMAGREIHAWVVLMSTASLLSHTVIFSLSLVYYIGVFGDLCHHMNLPLLTVCRNVYCDGVYDLCHIGHKNLFKRALTNGNRLFVGVCNDEDCSGYKRPPIMTHDERCAEVEACKAVTKVIPNAPCFGITQEFVDKHQIHVVAMGQEYFDKYPNPDDDPYYGYVRKIGIAKGMPRTPGLSTSDLIKRIQKAAPADQRNDKKGK